VLRRDISLDMFSKILDLDLRWHLLRKTGEVTRILDRGTSAIQNTLSTGERLFRQGCNLLAWGATTIQNALSTGERLFRQGLHHACMASSGVSGRPPLALAALRAAGPTAALQHCCSGLCAGLLAGQPAVGMPCSGLRRVSPIVLAAVLFNIVPQLFDIVAACIFISAALEPWIAVIVFITLGSYIPVTIFLTEWRVKHRRCAAALSLAHTCRMLAAHFPCQNPALPARSEPPAKAPCLALCVSAHSCAACCHGRACKLNNKQSRLGTHAAPKP
jgi:hypothetical protein